MSTAAGTIVIQNLTDAGGVNYWVGGVGSGAPGFCSGVLGIVSSGNPQAKCAVSGYDYYQVYVGPIGSSPSTSASVQAQVGQTVSLGTTIS